jgi:hypothetical protein
MLLTPPKSELRRWKENKRAQEVSDLPVNERARKIDHIYASIVQVYGYVGHLS